MANATRPPTRPGAPGSPPAKRRGKGRPPASERPLSQAEIQQRRGAAWKHGRHAATALGQTVHPCRKDLCPLDATRPTVGADAQLHRPLETTTAPSQGYDTCAVRTVAAEQDRGLSACPVELVVNPDLLSRYRDALAHGKVDGVREIAATALASMAATGLGELGKLHAEGTVIEQDLYAKDGTPIGTERRVNPRAAPTFELARMAGWTADQQAITPKASGENARDRAVAQTAELLRRRAEIARLASSKAVA